jgi:chromosome segregation ATPase
MEKLDILEQKVLSAVTKINQIEADRKELKRQLDATSAEVEALELEKKHLLGEIEELKNLKDENERLRESIEAARKRVEGIISKIEAAGVGEEQNTEIPEEDKGRPTDNSGVKEPEEPVEETDETPGEEGEDSESIFDG